jgi:hypothetical protein
MGRWRAAQKKIGTAPVDEWTRRMKRRRSYLRGFPLFNVLLFNNLGFLANVRGTPQV